MRISDWSSDVCSSDLPAGGLHLFDQSLNGEGRAMAFLELNGVSKGYGAGAGRTEVLHDINLKVEEGEFIAIVGFSGSGKTTLMSQMGRAAGRERACQYV